MPTVNLDTDLCTGHAQCAFHAPDVFELDDLGHSSIKAVTLDASFLEQAHRAARACPEGAIALTDDSDPTGGVA